MANQNHCITSYLSVFSPNAGKYGLGKTPYLDTLYTVNSPRKHNKLQKYYVTDCRTLSYLMRPLLFKMFFFISAISESSPEKKMLFYFFRTFDCNLNSWTIRIARLLYYHLCFDEIFARTDVSFGWFHFGMFTKILSSEMKFHFCQNDRNEITPVMSLNSGYFIFKQLREIEETPNWKYFISSEIISPLNTR